MCAGPGARTMPKGIVAQAFTRRVKRRIEGEAIVRNANEAELAYLVRQADGGRVLKSESELSKA
jgi:hypothetical protein